MKKISFFAVLASLLLLLSFSARAEVRSFIYADVYFVKAGGLFSNKCNLALDLGCKMKATARHDYLENAEGKPMRFNSSVSGLNYLGQDGWEVINVVLPADKDSTGRYHYLMKKETTGMTAAEVMQFIDRYRIRNKKAEK